MRMPCECVCVWCVSGEMLLHKLARVTGEEKKENLKTVLMLLSKLMREQAKAAGKKNIVGDVQHMAKNGKTCLQVRYY